MEFIDKPTFGHTKFKLSVVLVPVIMFAVLIMGIVASKLYVSSVVADSHSSLNNLCPQGKSSGRLWLSMNWSA